MTAQSRTGDPCSNCGMTYDTCTRRIIELGKGACCGTCSVVETHNERRSDEVVSTEGRLPLYDIRDKLSLLILEIQREHREGRVAVPVFDEFDEPWATGCTRCDSSWCVMGPVLKKLHDLVAQVNRVL